jgi:hypothetical protein
MKDMFETEIVWVCFTIKIYQMPDSACALPFVTMVTSPNIFKVLFPKVRKERPEMLRLILGTKSVLPFLNNTGNFL